MVRAGGESRGVRGPVALEKLLRPVLAEGGAVQGGQGNHGDRER